MPIPLAVWGIAAVGGGFLTGALSRQPEINKLHNEVDKLQQEIKKLQEEVKRLQSLLKEQDRQINILKTKYHTARGINFIEKSKAKKKVKGAVMYTYCLKEYLDIKNNMIIKENYKTTNEESAFIESFELILNGNIKNTPEDNAKKQYIKEYIRNIYGEEIDSLDECNLNSIIEKIERENVA